MSIKSMQNLYKILSQELSNNLNDSTNNSTPSKRNTKDNLSRFFCYACLKHSVWLKIEYAMQLLTQQE